MKRILKMALLICLTLALAAPAFTAEENVQWIVTKDNKQPLGDAPLN